MRTTNVLAAGFLGIGFVWVSYAMILLEPGMGFQSLGDFFDGQKVAAGYASTVWLVSNFVYLAFPISLIALALHSKDPLLQWSGLASALLWLIVGAIDRVGIQLPALVASDEALVAAIAATMPTRFAFLKGAVATLGVFAWRTTRAGSAECPPPLVWRALGWVVLALSVGFLFAFIPVPIAFAVWALTLTVRHSLAPSGRGTTEVARA